MNWNFLHHSCSKREFIKRVGGAVVKTAGGLYVVEKAADIAKAGPPPPMLRQRMAGQVRRVVAASSVTYMGYNVVGSTNTALSSTTMRYSGPYTAPKTGNITAIEIYTSNSYAGTISLAVGYYSDSSGPLSRLANTQFTDLENWAASWKSFPVNYAVTSGTAYWLAFHASQEITMYYNVGASGVSRYYNRGSYAFPLPDPGTTNTNSTANVSVRAVVV